jgi:recombination protein RecA
VVELAAPFALGGATSIALAAVRAGQGRAKEAWCAWVDPEASLYAPGVVRAGVDVSRLLVVCPEREAFGRTAVKVVASGAFEVVVLDVDAMSRSGSPARSDRQSLRKKPLAPEVLVRKLALAAEPNGATVLLLTDSTRPRAVPWPVALRLELRRPSLGDLTVRVAKDRRGRVGVAATVPFRPLLGFSGWLGAPPPNLQDWAAFPAHTAG